MGVSFKVSKTGKRFQLKSFSNALREEQPKDGVIAAVSKKNDDPVKKLLGDNLDHKGTAELSDNEVSFILSLFPDGYSVAKPTEGGSAPLTPINVPKSLLMYDRASETLFSAIESGKLPAGVLDDIPGKYVDGTLLCEVRDYRNCFPNGINVVSGGTTPVVNKVSLKMSLDNLVMDIPALSDDGWTYGDMMEVESRILNALQPKLALDPNLKLDRLSQNHVPSNLKFGIARTRRKRWTRIPDVALSSSNVRERKIFLDTVHEISKLRESGPLAPQLSSEKSNFQGNIQRSKSIASDGSIIPFSLVSHQPNYPIGVGSHIMMRDQQPSSLLNASVASPGGQNEQAFAVTNKKARRGHPDSDGNMHKLGTQVEKSQNSELHLKSLMTQQKPIRKGVQYANNGKENYPQQVYEGSHNHEERSVPFNIGQQGIRYNLKEEPIEMELELNVMESQQPRMQQKMSHQLSRSSLPQSAWNNLAHAFDDNTRKEDAIKKRKLVQSPRASAEGLPQSSLSSKSEDFSTGSVGPQFGATVGYAQSQNEKSALTSISSVNGNLFFNTSVNDSMQQENLANAAAKWSSNSLQKKPVVSGVGSPASVSNMSPIINTSCPPIGDSSLLERLSKIQIASTRSQLHVRKNKAYKYPIRKPSSHSTPYLDFVLSYDSISDELSDKTCKMPLSKSLIGGNVNICKTRIMNFERNDHTSQGSTLMMSEKESDGSVPFYIGDIEAADYMIAEDYLPILPNTHAADLFAAQYRSLMESEGYYTSDHVEPKHRRGPVPVSQFYASEFSSTGAPPSQMQMGQGLFPRFSSTLPQSLQQTHCQRTPTMLPENSVQHPENIYSNANMELSSHMTTKPSHHQLQLLQQLVEAHQSEILRKMMSNLGMGASNRSIMNQNPLSSSSASSLNNPLMHHCSSAGVSILDPARLNSSVIKIRFP